MSFLSPRRNLTLTVLAFAVIAVPAAAHGPRPETLPLPDGFQPEGIATLDHDGVLVGSIPTGALYRVNVRTGEGLAARRRRRRTRRTRWYGSASENQLGS